MNDLQNFYNFLIQTGLIDVSAFTEESNGQWTLTKDYAGLPVGTTYSSKEDLLEHVGAVSLAHFKEAHTLRKVG